MIPAGGPDPRAPGGHGWVYRMAEGQQAFSGRHPIQSGICVDATDIRPMTPVERLIFSALEGFMEVHPRMQAQIEEGATALAASESRAADAAARAEAAEKAPDEARILARRVLTWFDLGDDRSTFPPALLADLRAAAQVQP